MLTHAGNYETLLGAPREAMLTRQEAVAYANTSPHMRAQPVALSLCAVAAAAQALQLALHHVQRAPQQEAEPKLLRAALQQELLVRVSTRLHTSICARAATSAATRAAVYIRTQGGIHVCIYEYE
jgi:hypothetical protein